jgi:branched-chain amino acid transport system substrate-binding protein
VRSISRLMLPLSLLALLLGLAACGSSSGGSSSGGSGATASDGGSGSGEVTIYSSLPFQGATKGQAEAISNGEKLALKEAGGKAGQFTVKFVQLDDSTASSGSWEPQAVSGNARKAIQDSSTIAYIGEYNSGASAVSIPILNEAGIPQLSVSSAVGLTTSGPGTEPGEPEKYYPTGKRTFVRDVPRDTVQGEAIATLMKEEGCTTVTLLNDQEVYGAGLARNVNDSAEELGLEVVENGAMDPKAANYRALASNIDSSCIAFLGVTANNAVQLFKDLSAADPSAKLFGPDGVAEESFTDPAQGGLPPEIASKVKVTVATLPPEDYPPAGQQFFADYTKEYGVADPDPYAIYGYELMRLALEAIEEAGPEGNNREAVLEKLFAGKVHDSVLGKFSIDENGDTSLTTYGVYAIKDGALSFDKSIEAK